MTETNGHGGWAILYARVSTPEQTKGYSVRQQLERGREWCAENGYRVLAEVKEEGESGMFLDRDGLDRARELIEAAEPRVSVAWAQDADRITRKAAHRLALDEEAERHGARWIALDDWGDESHEGALLKCMKGWVAEGESLKIRERSRRGARRKVSEGKLLGSSPYPRLGFAYNADRTGYVIDERRMAVVRRIFSELAGGRPVRSVALALDRDGIPTPRGGTAWSRRTIREMALDDVYRPHSVEALAGLVPDDVLAGLDPEGSYGIAWSGTVRTRKVSNSRRLRETPGREEQVGVPVRLDGSGLDDATVDAARRVMEGNRVPRKVGDRDFELAGGPLRCAHCGRRMIGYARRHEGRPPNVYYRCDSPTRTGSTCPNRRSHPAAALEYDAQRLFQETASREALLRLYDEAIDEQGRRLGLRGAAETLTALGEKLAELAEERRGYLRLAAKGHMSDDDLAEALAEVDEQREAISAEMRRTEDAAATARRIQAARASLAATYSPISAGWEEDPDAVTPYHFPTLGVTPEQPRAAYARLGARFELDEHGRLTLGMVLDLGASPLYSGSTHTATSTGSSMRGG